MNSEREKNPKSLESNSKCREIHVAKDGKTLIQIIDETNQLTF